MDLIQATRQRLFPLHKARATFVQSSVAIARRQQDVTIAQAVNKETSSNLTVLLVIVAGVGLLHALGIQCFFWLEPFEEVSPKPAIMEVSMINMPTAKPEVVPKPPSLSEIKQPHKKIQRKPKLKQQDFSTQGIAISHEDQVLLQQILQDFDMQQFAIDKPDQAAEAQTPAYKEAYLDAAYEHIPKPDNLARIYQID